MKMSIIGGLLAVIAMLALRSASAEPAPAVVYTEAQIQVGGETVYMDVAHTADVTPEGALGYVLTGARRTSPVTMFYNPTGGTQPVTQVSGALVGWNGYSGDFAYQYGGETATVSNICDGGGRNGENTITWGAAGAGILATACWYTGMAEECDIRISTAFAWGSSVDLQTVLLHESGHCLGLGHSADPSAVMYFQYHGVMRAPGADDIDGLCAIYGCTIPAPTPTATNTPSSPTNTPSPTRTNTPSPTATPTPTGPPVFILSARWNLLAAPYDTTAEAIGSANPCAKSIWLWDGTAWRGWFPNSLAASDLSVIVAGQGFWIWCE